MMFVSSLAVSENIGLVFNYRLDMLDELLPHRTVSRLFHNIW